MPTRKETLADLQAKREQHIADANRLLDVDSQELTAESSKAVQDHLDAVEAIDAEIAAVTQQMTAEQEMAAKLRQLRERPMNADIQRIVNNPDVPAMPRGHAPKAFAIPAYARNHQRITSFSDDPAGVRAEEKAYRFGQWCLAKASLDMPGQYHFPRAVAFAQQQGLLAHKEGSSDTTGSHLFVPEEFGLDLIKLRETYGVARQLCKMRTMTSSTRTDPKWTSGLTAYFVGEGSAITTSTMQHANVRLTAKKLGALATYSSELSEDAVIDIGNELAQEMAYAFALKEDQCFIDGDGTSTYGGIVGLKTSFATLTLGTAPGYRDSTGNTWAAIVLADITSLISVVPVYAQTGMNFLCSSQFYYQVMVPLINASGGLSGTEMQAGFRRPMFQGIPVIFSQVMPVATATSSTCLYLGNFGLGCTFGDRRQETVAFSSDAYVDSTSLFANDMLAVRTTERIDIAVHSFGDNSTAGPIVAMNTGS